MHSLTIHRPGEGPVAPAPALARMEALRQRLRMATVPGVPGLGGLGQDEILRLLREAFAEAFGHEAAARGRAWGFVSHGMADAGLFAHFDQERLKRLLVGVEEIIAALSPARETRSFPELDGLLDEVGRALDARLPRLVAGGLRQALAAIHAECARRRSPVPVLYGAPYGGYPPVAPPNLEGLRERGFATREEAFRLSWLESPAALPPVPDLRASFETLREVGRRVAAGVPVEDRPRPGYPGHHGYPGYHYD